MIIRMLGLFFTLFGIAIRLGYFKKMYFGSRGGIYGYIPMGLLFILYTYYESVAAVHSESVTYFYIAFGFLIVCVLYLSIRKPRWIKPKWTLWVEKYPKKVIDAMAEDVKNNPDEWEKNTIDEESIKKWAKRVSRK